MAFTVQWKSHVSGTFSGRHSSRANSGGIFCDFVMAIPARRRPSQAISI